LIASALDEESVGIPASINTERTTSQLYLAARGSILSLLSCLPDAELINGGILHTERPASMATGLVVSSERGFLTTSWMTPASHFMISGSFLAGPTLRSI